MLGLEHTWKLHGGDSNEPKPRQVFVTQSRVLAEKVEEYFSNLLETLKIGACSLEERAEIANARKTVADQNGELVDRDDVINWRGDLPGRFSLLEDHHFPLFITFDRVSGYCAISSIIMCKLIAAMFDARARCSLRKAPGGPK